MTVQADAVPAVDRDASERRFTEAFQQYMPLVHRYIRNRLELREAHHADDLAQDTFLEFWRKYVLGGRDLAEPRALLCTIAKYKLFNHYDRLAKCERALDFADPANTAVTALSGTYGRDRPDAAQLVAELDATQEQMRDLSQKWRNLHKECCQLHLRIQKAADRQAHYSARLAKANRAEELALEAFRASCLRVGQLRAEIESLVGLGWQSTVLAPVSEGRTPSTVRNWRSDPTIPRCGAGHLLDRYNTSFNAEGARKCRACLRDDELLRRKGVAKPRATVQNPGLEKVRAMLADPAYLHLNVVTIGQRAGVHNSAIYRKLPVAELRQAAKAKAQEMAAAR